MALPHLDNTKNRIVILVGFILIIALGVLSTVGLIQWRVNTRTDDLKKANTILETGDYLSARKIYEKVIAANPNNFLAHFGLGMSWCAEALFKTELGIEKPVDWYPALYHMTIAKGLHENDRVKKNLAIFYFNFGICYKKEGDIEAAIKFIEQAVIYDPELFKALNLLGAMYHEHGYLEEARYYYKKTIHLRPDYAMAYFNLGALAWAEKDFTQSVSYFQQAVSLDPENTYFNQWLKKAHKRKGK